MIRVLIADDQTIVRAGFAALLAAQPDIDVVAQGGDGREAVRLAEAHRPDVVLMDIRMPGMDGIDATKRILSDPRNASTRVLVLTTFDVDEYVYEAPSRPGPAGSCSRTPRRRISSRRYAWWRAATPCWPRR